MICTRHSRTARADDNNDTHLFSLKYYRVNKFKSFLLNLGYKTHG